MSLQLLTHSLARRIACLQESWSLEHQLQEERRRSQALAAQNADLEDALVHADMEAKELHRWVNFATSMLENIVEKVTLLRLPPAHVDAFLYIY
jgi:hypothetical protein